MAAPSKITATFWDCGGVFLTNGWDHEERRSVVEHFGLDLQEFERRHPAANDAWERGRITLRDYLAQTVFYQARPFSEAEFIARMQSVNKVLHPEMIAFLRRLRCTSGSVGTYMLSNESKELMAYRIPTFGLTNLFDAFLVSAYIGLRKPEPEFYQCALDITQRKPEECVFIDDREENVAAAESLGIYGIIMKTPEKCLWELMRLGITAA